LAPAREPVVQDPEAETLRPGASAEESAVAEELAETRVLPANSALRDQAAVGRSLADHMRLDAAPLGSLARLQEPPERVSEQGRAAEPERVSERASEQGRAAVPERASERASEQGRAAVPERVSERASEQGRVAEAEPGLGGEPARAADRARMKSMEFWAH
jgi:hypothetical protein